MKKFYKKVITFICTISLCASFLTIPINTNAKIIDDIPTIGSAATSEIDFNNGKKSSVTGVIDAYSLDTKNICESLDGYSVFYHNEKVIEVDMNINISGYYSVDFIIPDTEKELFLSGLTPNDVDQITEDLMDYYEDGVDFSLESFEIIDTEKTGFEDGDEELCWAATDSNMLAYTGWGAKAGFKDTDDIFDLFACSVNNEGNFIDLGISWFLNGISSKNDFANVFYKKGSGGYLKQYCAENFCKGDYFLSNEYISIKKIRHLQESLRKGCGVGLNVQWLNSDETDFNGGHAITCWGYINDNSYKENDRRHYVSLIKTDSDSGELLNSDRRYASNQFEVINMKPYDFYDGIVKSWVFPSYYNGLFYGFTVLQPYTDALPLETDVASTLDKADDYDLVSKGVYMYNTPEKLFNEGNDVFYPDDDIYISPLFTNLGEKDFEGEYDFSVKVSDKNNNVLFSGSETASDKINFYEVSYGDIYLKIPGGTLPLGDYTISVTINSKDIKEAYHQNNTYTDTFKVKESIDFKDFKMSLDIGEIKGYTPVSINTVNDECLGEYSYNIAVSCFDGDNWLKSEIIPVNYDSDIPYFKISKYNAFRVTAIIKTSDGHSFNYDLGKYDMKYKLFACCSNINNPEEYSPLESGDLKLKNGEELLVDIYNGSTESTDEVSGRFKIVALNQNTYEYSDVTDIYEMTATEKIKTINVTEDLNFEGLKGVYELLVTFATGDEDIDEIGYCEYLSKIKIKEPDSLVVTRADCSIDQYDGYTSFAEALKYSSDNDTITFDESIRGKELALTTSFNINKKITIDGMFYENGFKYPVGIIAANHTKNSIFNIESTGHLILKGFRFTGCTNTVIKNKCGKVDVDTCRFDHGRLGLKGAVVSEGGSVTAKNCSFCDNSGAYGTALYLSDSAKATMLNCFISNNDCINSTIYNNGGTLDIINSTIIDNKRMAIRSTKVCNILGSIVSDSGKLTGKINGYGSVFDSTEGINAVDCKTSYGDEIFGEAREYSPCYPDSYIYNGIIYSSSLPSICGVSVSVKDGKLYYNGIETNISATLPDKEYYLDCFGNQRDKVCGYISYKPTVSHFGEHIYSVVKCQKTEATCTTSGKTAVMQCEMCDLTTGGENIPATGHKYIVDVTPATINKNGKILEKCSDCKNTKTSVIKKVSLINLSATKFTYDGKVKNPVLTIKDSAGKSLVKGRDYILTTPKGRKNVGKYTYEILLKGNYSGTKTLSFVINPKGTSITYLKSASKGFTVKWKKNTVQTSGYQIRYGLKSDMPGSKIITVSDNKAVSKKITGLKAKKKYYVEIRTFKISKGTRLYSAWSKKKSVSL